MIISIHMPKTAGTTFAALLSGAFGERLLLDYGDWVGFNSPEALAHRRWRYQQARSRRGELTQAYDVIHGHFIADKYRDLFAVTEFVTFLRDPYQQAISNYEYIARNPQIDHPGVRFFHQNKMSFFDFVSWPDTVNIQSQLLGTIPAEVFAMIGLSERFTQSVALFGRIFGRRLASGIFENVNPGRQVTDRYLLTADMRKAVETYRAADLALYRRAMEIFHSLAAKYGL